MKEVLAKYNDLSQTEKIEFIKEIIPSIEVLMKENKNDLMKEFYPIIDSLLEKYGMSMDQIMLMLQMFNPQD